MTPRPSLPVAAATTRLDLDRRQALDHLISVVTRALAEAEALSAAALHLDRGALADSADRLGVVGADPAFDLRVMHEIYAALREAVVACQPGRVAPGPVVVAAVTELPPAAATVTDVEAVLVPMLVSPGLVPQPPDPSGRAPAQGRPTPGLDQATTAARPGPAVALRWPSEGRSTRWVAPAS